MRFQSQPFDIASIGRMNPEIQMLHDNRIARRAHAADGLDLNVLYLTIRDVVKKSGHSDNVVRYAIAKGKLVPALHSTKDRRGTLIHPDAYNAWITQLTQEKEQKKLSRRNRKHAA